MPVGTYGAVKGVHARELEEIGAQILLANAYHLWERPGSERIPGSGRPAPLHGVAWSHPYRQRWLPGHVASRATGDRRGRCYLQIAAGWPVPAATHQRPSCRFSLISGSTSPWSWTSAWPVRRLAPLPSAPWPAASAGPIEVDRWQSPLLVACSVSCRAASTPTCGPSTPDSSWRSTSMGMRLAVSRWAKARPRPGRVLAAATGELPVEKPRYVMGMGMPQDLVEAVFHGVDLFDCVIPTRHARNGMAFTREGVLVIRHTRHADDSRPLDPGCGCPTCRRYSRAYLRHLKLRGEMLAGVLMTIHNLWHYLDTMRAIRHAIASGVLGELRAQLARPEPRCGDG